MTMTAILLVVLLAVQPHLAESQCDPYDNHTWEDVGNCDAWFHMFEDALISNSDNLYVLRETFLSSSHSPPTLLVIRYNIYYGDSPVLYEGSPLVYDIGWSSSVLFQLIDPSLLYSTRVGILSIILHISGSEMQPQYINFKLNLKSPAEFNVTHSENTVAYYYHGLQALTIRLQAYAVKQDKLISWNGEDRNYIWADGSEALLLPISIILTVMITLYTFARTYSRILKYITEYHIHVVYAAALFSFMFTANVVTGFSIYTLITENTRVFLFPNTIYSYQVHHYLMISLDIVGVMLQIFCVAIGWKKTSASNIMHRFCKAMQFAAIFSFILLTAITAIPLVILALVYPVQVISVVAYLIAFCCIVTTSVSIVKTTKLRSKPITEFCNILCYGFLPCVAAIVIVLVYIKVQSANTGSNKLAEVLASVLPPAMISAAAYYIKVKKLKKEKKKDIPEEMEPLV